MLYFQDLQGEVPAVLLVGVGWHNGISVLYFSFIVSETSKHKYGGVRGYALPNFF